jgi:hypothetical protein
MNGRVYDPVVGMFLHPDNYNQMPEFAGGYNRFAYCMGNPLKYTDPSGEVFGFDDFLIGMAVGAIINGLTSEFQHPNSFWHGFCMGIVSGAITCGIPGLGELVGLEGALWGACLGALGGVTAIAATNGLQSFVKGNGFSYGVKKGSNYWSAAISGFISGGINGYQNAEAKGLNPWTGVTKKFEYTTVTITLKEYKIIQAGSDKRFMREKFSFVDSKRNKANQAVIVITADVSENYKDLQFFQTVDDIKVDVAPGSPPPFYNSKYINDDVKLFGGRVAMSDAPNRINWYKESKWGSIKSEIFMENIPNQVFNATTSLMGMNSSGSWVRLDSFSWGFTIDGAGVMGLTPFTSHVAPSAYHLEHLPK